MGDELARSQVPERAVGAMLVVVEASGFDLPPGVLERDELMHVQALVAQAPVEGFDVGVLHRGPSPGERQVRSLRAVRTQAILHRLSPVGARRSGYGLGCRMV